MEPDSQMVSYGKSLNVAFKDSEIFLSSNSLMYIFLKTIMNSLFLNVWENLDSLSFFLGWSRMAKIQEIIGVFKRPTLIVHMTFRENLG